MPDAAIVDGVVPFVDNVFLLKMDGQMVMARVVMMMIMMWDCRFLGRGS